MEAAFLYKDEIQKPSVRAAALIPSICDLTNWSHGITGWSRHFTRTTSFGVAVTTDYAMYLFTYFRNNRLFASKEKNRMSLNNRFGGELNLIRGKTSFVCYREWRHIWRQNCALVAVKVTIFSSSPRSLDARSSSSISRSTSNHTQNMNKELMYHTPKHAQNMNKELQYYFHEVDSKYQGFYCATETFW